MEPIGLLAESQDGVVTAAQCHDAGISAEAIRRRCRSGEWQRLYRGTYLTSPAPGDPSLRCRAWAATLALGPDAVVALDTAALLQNLPGLPPLDGRIHVSVRRTSPRHHRDGMRLHFLSLLPEHVESMSGLPVTTPFRTLADLVPRLPRRSAVSLLDAGLHAGILPDLDGLRAHWQGQPRRAWARSWLQLADGRAASPLETRVRLDCVAGGVPPEELQYPVYLDGILLGIADLAWPSRRLLAEADGAGPHSEPPALFRDRRRQNDLVRSGWTVLRFTWADTRRRGYVAATIRAALAAVGSC
jgi:hypothetical protein